MFGSTDDNNYKSKKSRAEQREKLGLAPAPKGKSTSKTPSEPTNALQQVEVCVCALLVTQVQLIETSHCHYLIWGLLKKPVGEAKAR